MIPAKCRICRHGTYGRKIKLEKEIREIYRKRKSEKTRKRERFNKAKNNNQQIK